MAFCVDVEIEKGSIYLGKGALSKLFLKNNTCFPWFVLVPQIENVTELYHLKAADQILLMEEITALSKLIDTVFKPKNSMSQILAIWCHNCISIFSGAMKMTPCGLMAFGKRSSSSALSTSGIEGVNATVKKILDERPYSIIRSGLNLW